jgi:thioredoxin-like negative regulator of GroEL
MKHSIPNVNFESRILRRSQKVPVILEMAMNYCGPCLWMEKIIADIVSSYAGKMDFVSLHSQDYPKISKELNLRKNPTIILFWKGVEKARFTGAIPAYAIEQWIEDNVDMGDV